MKLTKLFTVGIVAISVAGFTNPTQVTGQEPASKVELDKSPAKGTGAVSGKTETKSSETRALKSESTAETPKILVSSSDSAPQRTLVPGTEVDLSAVMKADWVQGTPPKTFEPGKIYIFECWSTLCGPCIGMIPHVNDLHNKYYDKGLRIYGMSVYENEKDEVVKFVKEKGDGMSYPVAFTGENGAFEMEWMKPAGAKGIPHAFIVRNGKLLESTLASRLTDELVETMLSGDEGAKKAAATISAAKAHAAEIAGLLGNIKSARRKKDTETMIANIEKLKVVEPDHPEIHTEELWVLMIRKQWPEAVTTLNEMPASWAKDFFVSMNGMSIARQNNRGYPVGFKKAFTHSYADYVANNEYVGPNHFACLSILQWRIGEKQNAITTANGIIESANIHSKGRESYVKPYMRFKDSVNEGTMPEWSDLSKWLRESSEAARADK